MVKSFESLDDFHPPTEAIARFLHIMQIELTAVTAIIVLSGFLVLSLDLVFQALGASNHQNFRILKP